MPVQERVELDLDDVVAENVLATRHVRANLVRFVVERDENHVQVLVVITQVDIRGLGSRRAVFGFSLGKAVDVGHHRRQIAENMTVKRGHLAEYAVLSFPSRDPAIVSYFE